MMKRFTTEIFSLFLSLRRIVLPWLVKLVAHAEANARILWTAFWWVMSLLVTIEPMVKTGKNPGLYYIIRGLS